MCTSGARWHALWEVFVQTRRSESLGADAFLPALTEELIWSPDIEETQLDVEFLMELLDPEELLGEGSCLVPPA